MKFNSSVALATSQPVSQLDSTRRDRSPKELTKTNSFQVASTTFTSVLVLPFDNVKIDVASAEIYAQLLQEV